VGPEFRHIFLLTGVTMFNFDEKIIFFKKYADITREYGTDIFREFEER